MGAVTSLWQSFTAAFTSAFGLTPAAATSPTTPDAAPAATALTDAQRQAGIAYFEQAVTDAQAAITKSQSGIINKIGGWIFGNTATENSISGAVTIVQNTVLPDLKDFASQNTAAADAKFIDLAHTAEQQLAGIAGYSATTSFDAVISQTAVATEQTVKNKVVIPTVIGGSVLLAVAAVVAVLVFVFVYLPKPRHE